MKWIENNSPLHREMIEWRHWLHQRPELALNETLTSEFVYSQLSSFGLKPHQGLAKTGVVATLEGKAGEASIALRADMDALPILEQNTFEHVSQHVGKMHACGHDGHTTMLLGAAKFLSEHNDFYGRVHFVFQPAEESVGGGRIMVEEGLFDLFPADAVYGMHNWPALSTGTFAIHQRAVMAAVDTFTMQVIGKGGHAAMPDQTVDPTLMSAQIIVNLQSIVSRNLPPHEQAVVSVTQVRGGDAVNVIPDRVILKGTIRYYEPESGEYVRKRIQQIAKGIASGHGGDVTLSFEQGYPATINTPDCAQKCISAASEVVTEDAILTDLPPSMGAEDFAYMLQAKPGAYIWLGNGEGEGGCMLHNDRYDFNDEILATGASFWVQLVKQELGRDSTC